MAVTAPAQDNGLPMGKGATQHEFRSTFLITGLRMAGKVLGIVKTLVIAALFGASGALDAFWISYTIPQMMPGLILGVVTTAFIPSFVRSARNGYENIDWRGLNTLFTCVSIALIAIAVLVIVGRHGIVSVIAPGVPDDVHALAARLTALMSIAVMLFGINAMLSAIMQAMHRFGVMSLDSIITNLFIIIGAFLLVESHGVAGLAYAVIAGFGFHMLLLLWSNRDLIREKFRPAFAFRHADFVDPARHMFPLLLGFFGAIAMTIIDRMFVSTLDPGAISILVYASAIALLPMEVFGQAVFTAFYPGLSRCHANGDHRAMREAQVRGQRLLLFILLPTTVAFVMASGPAISLLFERGAFSSEASSLTAVTLAALAIGLPFRAINYFNFRTFHARKEPWTAIFIGFFGVIVNTLFDMLLIGPFGIVGIAAATSIAMAACAFLSTLILRRRQPDDFLRPMLTPVAKLVVMTVLFGATAAACMAGIEYWTQHWPTWLAHLAALACFAPALLVFLLAGLWLRLEEVHSAHRFLLRKTVNRSAT